MGWGERRGRAQTDCHLTCDQSPPSFPSSTCLPSNNHLSAAIAAATAGHVHGAPPLRPPHVVHSHCKFAFRHNRRRAARQSSHNCSPLLSVSVSSSSSSSSPEEAEREEGEGGEGEGDDAISESESELRSDDESDASDSLAVAEMSTTPSSPPCSAGRPYSPHQDSQQQHTTQERGQRTSHKEHTD
jgi:hypothetical protein